MRAKNWLWVIIALGAALRIYMNYFAGLPHNHTDTFMYYQQADAILSGGYINYGPNGYPFIIAFFKGVLPFLNLYACLSALNILLGSLSIFYVFRITGLIYNNIHIALIAAAIMAVYPNQLNYSRWLLTEIPCTFFLVVSYYTFLKNNYFSAGLLLGVAGIIRNTLLPIAVLLIIYDLIRYRKIRYQLIIGLLIPVMAVGGYCFQKTGEFSVSGNGTVNIIYAATAMGEIDWEAPQKHSEVKTESQAMDLYLTDLKRHPGVFIERRLASLWQLWGPFPTEKGRGTASSIILGFFNIFLLTFGLGALARNFHSKNIIPLIFPFLTITAIHTMLFSLSRYTTPVEPFLIILAAWSIYQIVSRILKKKEKVFFIKTILPFSDKITTN